MTNGKIEPGDKFGEWTVIDKSETKKGYFLCRCSCGTERDVCERNLLRGTSKSCGCSRYKKNLINPNIALIGAIFGEWTVLSLSEIKSGYLHCRCSCGIERDVKKTDLIKGTSTCCGHNRKKVEIGQTYNQLTALERIRENDKTFYICRCSCGQITKVLGSQLTSGKQKSCGCLYKKKIRHNTEVASIEIGTKFGELTVLENLGIKNGRTTYLVRCSCGEIKEVFGSSLFEGMISCGHLRSKAEYKILQFLQNNNISYSYQWTNDNFLLSSGRKCRFDFAIFKNNEDKIPLFVIEYNGSQHYNFAGTGWNNEENYHTTIQRDTEKVALCKKHNIPLEVIPYTEFDNLESIITSLLNKYETHTIE